MPIEFRGHAIEVPEGYEKLALAILKCGIPIGAIGLEPDSQEFFVNFQSSEDCEQFADLVVACAPKPVIEQLFGSDGCLMGTFSVEPTEEDDDYRVFTVVEVCLPISVRDDLTKVFEGASKMVQSDVSYCDSNARRSNGTISHDDPVPKSEWDGHIFSAVPGVDSLVPGELVRLSFHALEPQHIVERLWVKVTVVDEDEVTGIIDSPPASLTNLHRGDEVHFHKHQISRVAPPKKQAAMSNAHLN